MKFDRLRISGFKSFVDPTELLIPPGMTGVVGPNGCGKSNLLEALRWVMGETSYKNLRGSGMEDVIFSGSADRPARNSAQVTVTLDNSARQAPAQFNADDVLEVSRRIERDAGSAYHINGRDARARDVQMLFADASTGAHSIALVRQGQIGEIISAKPQARRRILEEAAGISGLHHRRHEAELRLRAAEQNLERLDDVVGEIENQLAALKRQARQATRYRRIADTIRKAEALLAHLKWAEATAQLNAAEAEARSAATQVEELTRSAAIAAHAELQSAETLPAFRDAEAQAAAGLRRLENEDRSLAAEAKRAEERQSDLEAEIERIAHDLEREAQLLDDNAAEVKALADEETALRAAIDNEAGAGDKARKAATAARTRLEASERELAERTAALAELRASGANLDARVRELTDRAQRIESELQSVTQQIEAIDARDAPDLAQTERELARATGEIARAEAEAAAAEAALSAARATETASRETATEAAGRADRLAAEAAALVRLAEEDGAGDRRLFDLITVTSGYEQALVAALGDDLEASTTGDGVIAWRALPPLPGDSALPRGVDALSGFVKAPAALDRRLALVGVIGGDTDGDTLQAQLGPGGRLVNRAGDLWRWDGYVARAGAPTAASRRLKARNRLAEIRDSLRHASAQKDRTAEALGQVQAAAKAAEAAEHQARGQWREAGKAADRARAARDAQERATRASREKRIALVEARGRIGRDLEDAATALAAARTASDGQPDLDAFETEMAPLQTRVGEERRALAEAETRAGSLAREAESRAARLKRIGTEIDRWRTRAHAATAQRRTLETRETEIKAILAELSRLPAEIAEKRSLLANTIATAERRRQEAADTLAKAETGLTELQKTARGLEASLAETREALARAEARHEAATERHGSAVAAIKDTLSVQPDGALTIAGYSAGDALPDAAKTEADLARMNGDRERLGAVNLRAEDEASEQGERLDTLRAERQDLEKAIARLRQGINSLNAKARLRLLEAFEKVNGHFRDLFGQLFGGGTAELKLTEADDLLDAGLQIVAQPPGKKPQVLTLLSGGEQALTAIALILAVFRTNPSPICVLDEVDAPLDDANVERFCNVIEILAHQTDTRFLVITHHAYTMAQMDRLFGVTMAENGVSQLVSVDLDTAHRYREAG